MNKNDLNLIEDYIDGKLQGDARISFEQRLKADKELADEYKSRINLEKLWVEADDYQKTKSQIGLMIQKKKPGFYRTKNFYYLSAAASIIILIGVYMFALNNDGSDRDYMSNTIASIEDSTTTNENVINLSYDIPKSYGVIDSATRNISLIAPINGEVFEKFETISFVWQSPSSQSDTLYIVNANTEDNILKLAISLSDTVISIQYPQFIDGDYYWYIHNMDQYGKFNITEMN